MATSKSDLERIRASLAAHAARCETLLRQLIESQNSLAESHVQLAEAQGRVHELQEQVERLRDQLELRQEEGFWALLVERLRAENDRLHAEVDEFRNQTAAAAGLEGILRAELQATRTQARQVELHTLEATAEELDETRDERDRLQAEVRAAEADRLRLAGLAQELEVLRADRDRLGALRQAGEARENELRARIEEIESRTGAERDQAEALRLAWQEDLERASRERLEALRRELTTAESKAAAAKAGAAATREELECRLAELEDRLGAANDQSERLTSELQAERDRATARQREDEPAQSRAGADEPRIEALTALLAEARAANERLRALLNAFGLVDHLESADPRARASASPSG
jgi:chromosome segregation ATPase